MQKRRGRNRRHPEADFQAAIVGALKGLVADARLPYVLLESFGLDIAVFLQREGRSVAKLIEVKSYGGQRMGGVGFGNGKGEGAQVNLLLKPDVELSLLDGSARWVMARLAEKQINLLEPGSERYTIFTCREAKAAAMGGVAKGKQNNLRISAFEGRWMTWDLLVEGLRQFILT